MNFKGALLYGTPTSARQRADRRLRAAIADASGSIAGIFRSMINGRSIETKILAVLYKGNFYVFSERYDRQAYDDEYREEEQVDRVETLQDANIDILFTRYLNSLKRSVIYECREYIFRINVSYHIYDERDEANNLRQLETTVPEITFEDSFEHELGFSYTWERNASVAKAKGFKRQIDYYKIKI